MYKHSKGKKKINSLIRQKKIGQSYEHYIYCSFGGLFQTNTHNTITSQFLMDWDNIFKLI